ncbi:nudix hydrolase 8-like [Argentina anserina]|uniref:nudix hydrolase 8-like n=1 Tax=Argentina anserina TaxID=57926 RepID=UPI00217626BA|nr:nudix hydrolase 8-like [Potentilla anserina]
MAETSMVSMYLTKDYYPFKRGLPNGFLWKQFLAETSTTSKLKFLCPPILGASFKKMNCCVLSPNKSSPSVMMPELLDAWNDEYDGVIINPESLPMSSNAFASAVQASLSKWKMKGKRGVWLKILQEQADLVPIAIQEGFNFHHAEPGYVMLTFWIPSEPCMLPDSPSHHIGIGAFVINDKREVLVVKEKCSCSSSGVWKIPTGYINKSEDIFSGATREVKEETGIETTFLKMVAFRHAHKVSFEQSDLLFVCMLKPLSSEITIDDKEIQDAKWMPLDEFTEQPYYEDDHLSNKVIDICIAAHGDNYSGFIGHQLNSKIDGKLSYLYCDHVN